MVVSRYSNQGEKYIAVKRMTSPYYNWIVPQKHYHPSRAAERAADELRVAELTAPIQYDKCSACGCDDKPTTGTIIAEEVIINCNDCQLPPQRAGAMPPGSWDAETIGFSID